jgi:hypothetical protein
MTIFLLRRFHEIVEWEEGYTVCAAEQFNVEMVCGIVTF